MKDRLKGSAILVALIALVLWQFGRPGILLLLLTTAFLSQLEFLSLLRRMNFAALPIQTLVWTLLIPTILWFSNAALVWPILLPLTFIALLLEGFLKNSPKEMVRSVAASFLALLYVPFSLSFAVLLLSPERLNGPLLLVWTVLISKLTDIGGLLVGKSFGSRPMASRYSPKKTVEGSLGGLLFSLAGSLIFWSALGRPGAVRWPIFPLITMTVLLSAVAILSDLFESALKRLANVKDSGQLIPGIGGALDFSDSLLLTLPFAHMLLQAMDVWNLWP